MRSWLPLPWLVAAVALSCSGTREPPPRLSRVAVEPARPARVTRVEHRRAASGPAASAAPGDRGESHVPAAREPEVPEPEPAPPELVALAREVVIYEKPTRRSDKVGYLRLGARVARAAEPAGRDGCSGGWYRVMPYGFVCVGTAATTDVTTPLATLAHTRPNRDRPLPYVYGRAKALPPPLYSELPSPEELRRLEGRAPSLASGWMDLPVAEGGELVMPGKPLPSPLGYARPSGPTPRALPNAGFALLDAYVHDGRRYGLTTDLELIPLDRMTPVPESEFFGLTLGDDATLPVAFARTRSAWLYEGNPSRGLRPSRLLARREAFPLSGERRAFGGITYFAAGPDLWVRAEEVLVVERREALPPWATGAKSWLHVAIGDQTLVAYRGAQPVYVTLVSTGAGGLGDPKETHATPRGEFVVHTKHVSVNMSGDELGDEFDLRDVPYVQYFTEGYALHAAYWHDAFGRARSHGCVNLSPADARALFHLTEPNVPLAWHGAYSRTGTLISITP